MLVDRVFNLCDCNCTPLSGIQKSMKTYADSWDWLTALVLLLVGGMGIYHRIRLSLPVSWCCIGGGGMLAALLILKRFSY